MAEILNTLQGRAAVDVWIGGRSILTPDLFVFNSAACVDSVFGHRTWTLQLQAVSNAAYETIIVPMLLSEERSVQVRWGIDTGAQTAWLPLETFRVLPATVDLYTATGSRQGNSFTLTVGDVFINMDLNQRVVGYSGKISDIVTEIALRYGLNPIVEPTGGPPVNLIQSYDTDLRFLQQRLLTAAFNRNGVASYYCYADQGSLHFHTREWQQMPWVIPYNLGSGASLLMATDDAQTAARKGGQNQRTIAYDPLTGLTTTLTADPQRYTRLASRLSTATAAVLRSVHVGPNQAAWPAAQTQASYSAQRDQFERITFSIANAPDVKAGIILLLQLPNGQASANGYYFVEKTELSITGGVARSVVTAARGEVAGRVAATAVQTAGARSADSLTSPLAADAAPLAPAARAPGTDPLFQPAPQFGSTPLRTTSTVRAGDS